MRKVIVAILTGVVGLSLTKAQVGDEQRTLHAVSIQQVVIEDGFWTPKRKIWQQVTLRDAFGKFEKDRGGAINNFDRVRDGKQGDHAGPPWYDGLIYEMIRASADFLKAVPDPELQKQLDGYIERIAAAAARDPDGYINTWTQLMEPDHRWGFNGGYLRWQHDVYNAGALIEAAVHYYQATGKTELLRVAVKFANHMYEVMGPPPKKNIVPAHSGPEEAIVKLYQLFVDQPGLKEELGVPIEETHYLELAEFWIENRGKHAGLPNWEEWGHDKSAEFIRNQGYGDSRPSWGAYAQDHQPVLEQQTIEGHAVRATLMATGLVATGMANGRSDYLEAALRLWNNMVSQKMHITGGVGATAQNEAFSGNYVLPNDAYLETCAAVGAGFFHHNMTRAFGNARYVDELERTLYNNVLAGVSLEGNTYFYRNPLEADQSRSRWVWHDCPCCPPMFLKMMGSLPEYIYAYDDKGVYVHLFVGSRASFPFRDKQLGIVQKTEYPWEGTVSIRLEPEQPSEFDLSLRIPSWAPTTRLKVNGKPVAYQTSQGYARLRRTWKKGDEIELDIPMNIRRIKSHPQVRENRGRFALMRGPIVYCLESIDNQGHTHDLRINPESELRAEYRPDLLNGAAVIRGRAAVQDARAWGRSLYLDLNMMPEGESIEFVAIPYYANSNRGPTDMTVWIPE